MLRERQLQRPGLAAAGFDLADGECLTVRGPSGAGKTLLLRALADLDPNHGEVHLDGQARDAMPAPQWRRRVVQVDGSPQFPGAQQPGRFSGKATLGRASVASCHR